MAARIVVPESVEKPYEYYRDNVAKSLELFDQLEQLGKPRVLFSSLGQPVRAEGRLRGRRVRPAGAHVAVRPDQADDGAGPPGHGGRDRAARDHPALLQPDRLRPGPRVRHLRQGAVARPRPAGDGGARAEGLVHDHRHRPARRATAPGSATTSTSGTSPARTCARSSSSTRCSTKVGAPSVIINLGTGDGTTVRELSRRSRTSSATPVPVTRGAPVVPATRPAPSPTSTRRRPARLADRAVPRGRHRLRARLGREAPGDPGLRVSSSALVASAVAAAGGSAPASAAAVRRRSHRPRLDHGGSSSTAPLAGRTIVIDPGHQLGNHNFPAEINKQVPGRRLQQAVQHDRDGDRRWVRRGDVRLAGRGAAQDEAREARRPRRADPQVQQPEALGPVRRPPRPGRQQAPAPTSRSRSTATAPTRPAPTAST